MTFLLTNRQKEILIRLRKKDAGRNAVSFYKLERGEISSENIEILCSLINSEFMMKGVFPNFEPNEYGVELENLLDEINRPRVAS